jgi:sigma-B regulation protein RsbU (phosphoserine phosphatase)
MKKESIHSILTRINNEIIQQKGDIDNYMTGILCRFTENKNDNTCHVEIGNAGHPYPLKFTAKTGEVTEIRDDSEKKHFGAIGMQGIAVSFADSDFTMTTGDILIFFTDGLTEATNPQLGQFGTEELKTIIKVNRNKSTEEILKIIRKRLSVFVQNKPLEDDITIIIAKRTDPDNFVPEEEPEVEMIIEPKDEQIEELQSAE